MILGIGSDIIDIRRIEKLLDQFGKRFENRIFTDTEQRKALSKKNAGAKIVASAYAKRFAAKEACMKGLGIHKNSGVSWKDIEIINLPSGIPSIELHGNTKEKLAALTPPNMKPSIHVSLSDDYPFAQAYVIISAEYITPSPSQGEGRGEGSIRHTTNPHPTPLPEREREK